MKCPVVAVAAALLASAFGAAAPAAADSPVDPAAAAQNAERSADTNGAAAAAPAMHQGDSLARGAAGAAPAATVREVVDRVAGRTPAVRPPSGGPVRPASPARPAAGATAAPIRALAIAGGALRGSRDRRSAPPRHGRAANTSSPPHGWKATPPARSVPERAVGLRTAPHRAASRPAPDRVPGGTGTTIGAGSPVVPSAVFLVALLIVALAVSRTLDLRPLRIPAPTWRRLVFVAPAVPPG